VYDLDIAAMQRLESGTGRMCLVMATNYLVAAELQLNRMIQAVRRSDELEAELAERGEDPDWQSQVVVNGIGQFADTHFYLICVDKIHKLLLKLTAAERDPKLAMVWERVEPDLKPFREARNHFEHMESRIETYGAGFGRFSESTWTFQGTDYSIGAASFQKVTKGFEALLAAIKARSAGRT
jgi:hypothetical protein